VAVRAGLRAKEPFRNLPGAAQHRGIIHMHAGREVAGSVNDDRGSAENAEKPHSRLQ
jgi:hypothetical protein